jgi:hypothetical protein
MPLPHRSSACWSQPKADGVVVPHVGPLVEGKRRELDRRDVCPGDPTGQRRAPDPRSHHPPEGLERFTHAVDSGVFMSQDCLGSAPLECPGPDRPESSSIIIGRHLALHALLRERLR